MTTLVGADLEFTLERADGDPVRGRIRERAGRLVLEVDDATAFAGPDSPFVTAVAEGLAGRGMTLRVAQGERRLATLGAQTSWWKRLPREEVRGAIASWRTRTRPTPATALPVGDDAPTALRRVRAPRAPSLTAPRLVLDGPDDLEVPLHDGLTIGSGRRADVRLPGLAEVHAVVRHEHGGWVVETTSEDRRAPVLRQLLRPGSRVTLGTHRFAFVRAQDARVHVYERPALHLRPRED